ncbi:MAG: PQQ-like beta-propeller repeat protein [Candidatus Aenigmarchaeota archaeon]|nr:PQQ-like beta-propeller repeat protein [Candidatus Aenigmarchaeota archaeon]
MADYLAGERGQPAPVPQDQDLQHETEHFNMLTQAQDAILRFGKPQVWNVQAGGGSILGGIALAGGRLVFGACDKNLYAVREGRKEWAAPAEHIILTTPAVADAIYYGAFDNRFYCLSPEGQAAWRIPVRGPVHSPPALREGRLYFGTKSGYLYAMTTEGAIAWTFTIRAPITSKPALLPEGIAFGGWDNQVRLLSPSGRLLWSFAANGLIPAIGEHEGNLYAGSVDKTFYSLSPEGRLRWKYQGQAPFAAAPAFQGDQVLVPGYDCSLTSLSTEGELLWKFKTPQPVDSTPAVAGGRIFFGCNDGNLYCLSLKGELLWRFPTPWPLLACAPLAWDGKVSFGSYDGNLYTLSSSGRKEWTFKTPISHGAHIEVDIPQLAGGQALVAQHLAPAQQGPQGPDTLGRGYKGGTDFGKEVSDYSSGHEMTVTSSLTELRKKKGYAEH